MNKSAVKIHDLVTAIREVLAERIRAAIMTGLDEEAKSFCREAEELRKWRDNATTTLDDLHSQLAAPDKTSGE